MHTLANSPPISSTTTSCLIRELIAFSGFAPCLSILFIENTHDYRRHGPSLACNSKNSFKSFTPLFLSAEIIKTFLKSPILLIVSVTSKSFEGLIRSILFITKTIFWPDFLIISIKKCILNVNFAILYLHVIFTFCACGFVDKLVIVITVMRFNPNPVNLINAAKII